MSAVRAETGVVLTPTEVQSWLHALYGGAEIETFETSDDSIDPWDEIDARLDAERRTGSGE